MRGEIDGWLLPYCPALIGRVLYRQAAPQTPEYFMLLRAGNACLDSLANFSSQTSANDSLVCDRPLFTMNDHRGLMQSRVAAEVMIAGGLEQVCVGNNAQATIDLLVKYSHDTELQKMVEEYITANREHQRGFFCTLRVPRGWKSVIEFYLDSHRKGEKPRYYQIPSLGLANYSNLEVGPDEAILQQLLKYHG